MTSYLRRARAISAGHSLMLCATLSTLVACGGSETKAALPTTQVSPGRHIDVATAKPTDDATRGTIKIANNILKACGMTASDAHFAFDSAHVRAKDQQALRTLADCFGSGPLKGRQMSLIGHADPRGTQDYNLALGGRRADNVKLIIVAEAMNGEKVSTTSRGAMDATGTDEVTWASDRYVEVALGD